MSQLIPFQFEETHTIRAVTIDGNMWFVAKDVAEVLGYVNHNKAISDHCKGVTKRYPLQTPGGIQEIRIINEPDVYRLIAKSRLPEAERFEKWIFEEVLPSIRKTGSYSARQPAQNPDIANALYIAKESARLARVFGFQGNMIPLAANNVARAVTGVDVLALMDATHLPANPNGQTYTPTELGRLMKPVMSAYRVNVLLADSGLQVREESHWIPTSLADGLFEWLDTGKRHINGTPVKQLKWFRLVLEKIDGETTIVA